MILYLPGPKDLFASIFDTAIVVPYSVTSIIYIQVLKRWKEKDYVNLKFSNFHYPTHYKVELMGCRPMIPCQSNLKSFHRGLQPQARPQTRNKTSSRRRINYDYTTHASANGRDSTIS